MDYGEDNQYIEEYFNQKDSQFANCNSLKNIYDALCVIECDIINKVMGIGFINNGIKKAISLRREYKYKMPTCILIKLM